MRVEKFNDQMYQILEHLKRQTILDLNDICNNLFVKYFRLDNLTFRKKIIVFNFFLDSYVKIGQTWSYSAQMLVEMQRKSMIWSKVGKKSMKIVHLWELLR